MEIHELLVVKHDGKVDRFPVDGDLAQAELRAALTQHPGDLRIAVTEHAYIRLDDPQFEDGQWNEPGRLV